MPDKSYTNLKDALSTLTNVTRNLESRLKQAGASSNKIGEMLVAKKIISPADLNESMERKKREPGKYLGQILCEMGLPQSKIIKAIHYSHKRKKIGQILVELNIITDAQLRENLLQQEHLRNRGMHAPLGALLAINRVISEEHYLEALSAHFSMPIVGLRDYSVNPSLQKAIGEQFALKNRLVVLSNSRGKITVATAEPNLFIIEDLEKALPKEKHVMFFLAKASEIETCLDKQYEPEKHKHLRS